MLLSKFLILPLACFTVAKAAFIPDSLDRFRVKCNVKAGGSPDIDDAPAILKAFRDCNKFKGIIVFANTTYHVNSIMNTSDLKHVKIELHGTLKWSTNITYWLQNSLPTGYQNQSTAWYLGGDHVQLRGFGYGTLDGNGQTWYDFVKGQSNYPGRPHNVAFRYLTNSRVEGVRFVQSQMWTMTIIHSKNVVLDNIFVSSKSNSSQPARNTDGADTLFSSQITFSNWEVVNGDDSISCKANSTDIIIRDSKFYGGLGIAFGSIGQYEGMFETIERVRISNIQFFGTRYAVYWKTWTGERVGYPPNGGGGGLGFSSDISATNLTIANLTQYPFQIGQCTNFAGQRGNCTSSLFQVRDIDISNVRGSGAVSSKIADFRCAAVGCRNITIDDVNVTTAATGEEVTGYLCRNVVGTEGFECNQ